MAAVRRHMLPLLEQMATRDAQPIEADIANTIVGITQLEANVTNLDTRQQLVVLVVGLVRNISAYVVCVWTRRCRDNPLTSSRSCTKKKCTP